MQRDRPYRKEINMRVLGKTYTQKVVFTKPGSRYADKHAIKIDENGHKTLNKTGERTNIYLKIQAHADECDIEKILSRAEVEGYEILDRREVISGDVTLVPKSLLEAQITLQKQENDFNKLPLEVRKKFNFSFTEYIAEAGNNLKSWAEKMGYGPEPKQEPVLSFEKPETKEEKGDE